MYYLIKEKLEETDFDTCIRKEYPYVAIVDRDTFMDVKEQFGLGIDMDFAALHKERQAGYVTKAEVNYDSLTGSFNIPSKKPMDYTEIHFFFALDECGIIFIEDEPVVERYINDIQITKKWRSPSLERFIFDFLEAITKNDLELLENYEKEMDLLEDRILANEDEGIMERIVDIRSELQDLRVHYEQLLDLSQELTENENNFFLQENLRYFRLYSDRLFRFKDLVASLREYSMQLRDLYHYQMDMRQNRMMSVLTVVATIFMPLTLIAGWYGMNFKVMPELEWAWSYPVVIGVSICIAIGEILYFKKKKWL